MRRLPLAAFLTLVELSASNKRGSDQRKAGEFVQQCNQLIKLANVLAK